LKYTYELNVTKQQGSSDSICLRKLTGSFITVNMGMTCKLKNVIFWNVAVCRSCVNRHFGGTYHLHLQGRKIHEWGTSMSRQLQTEPPIGNNQLYKNRERDRVGHVEKQQRRGVGSVVKVKPADSRGSCICGRGAVGGGEKSRAD
jgi:hypothetical protein